MKPARLAVQCGACGYSFLSESVKDYQENTLYTNNVETCQKCGTMVKLPNGRTVRLRNAVSFLPEGSTITTNYLLMNRPTRKDKLYFSVGSTVPAGSTWSIHQSKNKGDVYITCREIPSWKLSLHTYGKDHIGITKERSKDPKNRSFYERGRAVCPAATCVRIARIVMTSESHWTTDLMITPLKNRFDTFLLPTRETGAATVDVLYSDGDPDDFMESYVPSERLMAKFRMPNDEFIVLAYNFIDYDHRSDFLEVKSTISRSVENPKIILPEITVDFGITSHDTFLIDVSHS